MSLTKRVVWQEDMFPRTQYFRQQERWIECLQRSRMQAAHPHPRGSVECAPDRDMLGTGREVVRCAAAVGPSPDAVRQTFPHSGRGLRV